MRLARHRARSMAVPRTLLAAVVGYVACDLPAWLHGAPTFWIWGCLGALAFAGGEGMAALWPRLQCVRLSSLACIATIGTGMTLDFTVIPPEALAYLCASDSGGLGIGLLLAHLRWFPVTTMGMLLLIAAEHLRAQRRAWMPAALVPGFALVAVTTEFVVMLVFMVLAMEVCKAAAQATGMPWTGDGMVSAMNAAMLFLLFLSSLRRANSAETHIPPDRKEGALVVPVNGEHA